MKRRMSIAVDKNDNQIPNAAEILVSSMVNDTIGREAHRIKTEMWKQENRKGAEDVARFITQHGSFADENRNW